MSLLADFTRIEMDALGLHATVVSEAHFGGAGLQR